MVRSTVSKMYDSESLWLLLWVYLWFKQSLLIICTIKVGVSMAQVYIIRTIKPQL